MSGYVVKVTIEHSSPNTWRRIVLPEGITFYQLHLILQAAFCWENEHLHDFSFSDSRETVGSSEDSDLDEKKIMVDDYIHSSRWIRYTYDFGDDWVHKIVFEKDDPSYDKPYAAILKARGDNYREDSGGVWSDERFQFSMAGSNKLLKTITVKTVIENDGYSTYNVDHKLKELEHFVNAWQAEETRAAELNGEKDTGTLTDLVRGKDTSSFHDLMHNREAKMLCEYLCIPVEKKNIDAENRYVETISAHPEYLLYLLGEEDLKELKDYLQAEEGDFLMLYDPSAVSHAIILGIAEVKYVYKKKLIQAHISFAKELPEILAKLDEKTCMQTLKMVHETDQAIMNLLEFYGVLEVGRLYEFYKKYNSPDLDHDAFMRVLNCHTSFVQNIERFHIDDNEETTYYVSLEGLDDQHLMDSIYVICHFYGSKDDFIRFDPHSENMAKLKKAEQKLQDILKRATPFGQETEEEITNNIIYEVRAGSGFQSFAKLMDFLMRNHPDYSSIEIWYTFMQVFLRMPMPYYNGYSRLQFEKKYHYDLKGELFIDADLVKQASKSTDLIRMPADLQMEVFHCIDEGDHAKAVELADKYDALKDLASFVPVVKKAKKPFVTHASHEHALDDSAFWQKLDQAGRHKRKDALLSAAMVIKEGYEQNLNFVGACIINENMANQCYVGDPENRWLLCYTSRKDAMKGAEKHHCDLMTLPVQDIINNLFHKKTIKGLLFNDSTDYKRFRVTRGELELAMPGDKPKPEGYAEA